MSTLEETAPDDCSIFCHGCGIEYWFPYGDGTVIEPCPRCGAGWTCTTIVLAKPQDVWKLKAPPEQP